MAVGERGTGSLSARPPLRGDGGLFKHSTGQLKFLSNELQLNLIQNYYNL